MSEKIRNEIEELTQRISDIDLQISRRNADMDILKAEVGGEKIDQTIFANFRQWKYKALYAKTKMIEERRKLRELIKLVGRTETRENTEKNRTLGRMIAAMPNGRLSRYAENEWDFETEHGVLSGSCETPVDALNWAWEQRKMDLEEQESSEMENDTRLVNKENKAI